MYPSFRTRLTATTAMLLLLSAGHASALPSGGNVTNGTATISTSGKTTTVTQSSSKSVINWNSFDTAAGETVKFVDPNASAITLNRIGGNATSFAGTMTANGNVWLINPNGMLFTGTSKINVGGLLATTSDISSPADFMSGKYTFKSANPNLGSVINNQGSITVAQAGMAALVAPAAANSGTITAKAGKITLASGDTFTVDLAGDGLINLAAKSISDQEVNTHGGTLNAGTVVITAAQASNLLDNVINLEGVINANSLTASNQSGDLVDSAQFSQSAGGNFSLSAYRNVTVEPNTAITPASGKLNVTLDSNDTGAAAGGAIFINQSQIVSNGGSITLGGGTDPLHDYAVGNTGLDASGYEAYTNGILMDDVSLLAGGGFITLHGKGLASSSESAGIASNFQGVPTINIETTGTGGIYLVGSGSQFGIDIGLNSITTQSGNITLTGTANASDVLPPDSGAVGVVLPNTLKAMSGNITVNGNVLGASTPNSPNLTYGVSMDYYQPTHLTTTSGNITLNGTGGGGCGSIGLEIADADVSSVTGKISLTGKSGNTVATNGSYLDSKGIFIDEATIESTGTGASAGDIVINGTGATGSSNNQVGVAINDDSLITAVDGDISITGTAKSTGNTGNIGVELMNGSTVQGTGYGNITLKGSGAGGAAGIYMGYDPSNVVQVNNAIDGLTDVNLLANTLSLNNYSILGQIVTFAPTTLTTSIGVAGGAGTLNISADTLTRVHASNYVFGSTGDTGLMTVGAHSWDGNVSFLNGSGSIKLSGIDSTSAGGDITFATLSGKFVNGAGADALQPDGGDWYVYATDASHVTLDGLKPTFTTYGCTYGQACSLPAGNGLIFSAAAN